MLNRRRIEVAGVIVLGATLLAAQPALATYHLMQIEQVIGGVNGDASAQAIQLRMRSSGQHLVHQGRVRAWDAAGANPIVIIDMTTDVTNQSTGDRVLIASSNFASFTSPAAVPDFVMTNLIPASYLAAGSITFEDDTGATIWWRLSWGGASYTGSNLGSNTNDSNGNFGPPYGAALQSTNTQAVKFPGTASAGSTSNSTDYSLSATPAVFTNNARTNFTVTAPPAPSINSGPSPVTVCAPAQAQFTVSASGVGTLTYQWQLNNVPLSNGGNISGATSSTLTISPTSGSDVGSYNVVVTNAGGSTPSGGASLTVNTAPVLQTSPGNQTVNVGDPVTMSASFTGTVTSYQWRLGGVPLSNGGTISGADTATLSISSAALSDAGSYDVVATNGCGPTPSNAATLTVNSPGCPGDLTGDNQVDLSDLGILLSNYGATNATPAQGDLNGDHLVDLSDLAIELSKYGTHC